MTEEEYEKIQDTVKFYELAYCIATNDFYYNGPYTRKCVGNKIYIQWPGMDYINELTLDELAYAPLLSEFADESAYFYFDTLEVNDESIKRFMTKIREYVDRKLMDKRIQNIITNYKNLEFKTSKDIEKE